MGWNDESIWVAEEVPDPGSARSFWDISVMSGACGSCFMALLHLLQWAVFRVFPRVPDSSSSGSSFSALATTTTDPKLKCKAACEFQTLRASTGIVLNASFMFLHNVLQCSTHGMCCRCIGSSVIMIAWQIALWVVQGIILFPSGEVRERSAEILLVSWLLHQWDEPGLHFVPI